MSRYARLLPFMVGMSVLVAWYALLQPLPVGVVQDDGLYAILAKALATGEGYRFINLPDAPPAAHYPPGYPALLALLWMISPEFPQNTALFMLVNCVLAGVAATGSWFLLRRLGAPSLVAAGVTVAGFVMLPTLALNTTLMSEPLWLALAFAWLLRAERCADGTAAGNAAGAGAAASRPAVAQAILMGLSGGAIALVRTQSVALVAGLLAILLLRRRWRAAAVAGAAAALVLLPWQLWVLEHAAAIPPALTGKYGSYGTWLLDGLRAGGPVLLVETARLNAISAAELIRGMFTPAFVPSILAAVVLLALGAAGGIRMARCAPVTLVALLAHAGIILFWPFDPRRFVWGTWPFIAIWLAAGVLELWERAHKGARAPATSAARAARARGSAGPAAIGALPARLAVGAAAGLLVLGALLSTAEGLRTESFRRVAMGGAWRLIPTVEWVQRHVAPDAIVATDDETAVYLYTGRRAVPASSFEAINYVTPDGLRAPSRTLDAVVERYHPHVVIAGWRTTSDAARRLTAGPAPLLAQVDTAPRASRTNTGAPGACRRTDRGAAMIRTMPAAPESISSPAEGRTGGRRRMDGLLGGNAPRMRGRTPLPVETLRLSVLIPAYNEQETIAHIIEQVRAVPVAKEIVCVDDCSTDATGKILDELLARGLVDRVIHQPVNRGKGAAIRAALAASTGNVVIVQDADLEYDPADWPMLLAPIVDGKADAVFGSRFLGGPHRVLFFWHSVGNKVLTTFSNMLTNLNLTDMETCYKAIRGDVARALAPRLRANRFGFEPEITARLARSGARIYEVPISYAGRTYAEGKKIGWRDGAAAIWHILKFNLLP